MVMPPISVLYEDNHLLIVNKPALLPTMGVQAGESSLWTLASQYIRQKYNKPGNVYLGIVSRLDAHVTGAVVLARTSKAAARLSELFRTGNVLKTYWAVVPGPLDPPVGEVRDWLVKDEQQHRMQVVGANTPHSKQARLAYRTLKFQSGFALLEIDLQTGRKHQIRVQLAARGHAIVGDRKYGSSQMFPAGIALHARRLAMIHPVRQIPLEVIAPVPGTWKKFGIS